MIQKVSFRNFKAYRSLDLELEPFTVLVGPNASGKTTLLQGLDFISNMGALTIGAEGLAPTTWASPAVQSYGSSAPVEISIRGVWADSEGAFSIVSTDDASGEKRGDVKDGSYFSASGDWGGKRFRIGPARPGDYVPTAYHPTLATFGSALSSTTVLRFEPGRMTAASYSEDVIPKVRSDGSELAAVLAYLKLERDEIFNEIELALKQIVPALRRIRIERAAVERTSIRTLALDDQSHQLPEKRTLWGNKIVLDMRGAKGVPADSAGEGTIMALGLLTVLMGPTKPRLALLDDIELGLHPTAQGKLIEVLRKIQQRDSGLQIIATSHSPFILNYLDPKEVRMTFLSENGFARCEKLTAHPEFERWKDLMSPGEFWSTVGESWVEKPGQTATHE